VLVELAKKLSIEVAQGRVPTKIVLKKARMQVKYREQLGKTRLEPSVDRYSLLVGSITEPDSLACQGLWEVIIPSITNTRI
jgi:hypothetical protein